MAYPGDLELFEQSQLLREFIDDCWEKPRIFLDDFEHVQLEDKFTCLFSFIFDQTEEVHFKFLSDVQYNDDGDYILGYVSIKISNKFVRETVIETAYLNMGTDKCKLSFCMMYIVNKCVNRPEMQFRVLLVQLGKSRKY